MPDQDPREQLAEIIAQVDNDPMVVTNEDGTRVVTLEEPIEVRRRGELQQIDSVSFRKPRGGDLLKMDEQKSDVAKGFAYAAALSGLPFKAFVDMAESDALRCTKVASVMGKSSEIGGTY